MPLADMQSCLTELYGLDIDYRVDDFLITDRDLARVLGGARSECEEELLILEEDGEAEVSLYLERDLVSRLERDNPFATLSGANFADFLIAFEGVSHFTYFAFNASRDQPVTLLELELQAEVDKCMAAAILIRRQGDRLPAGLHHWLFGAPRLRRDLNCEEAERYERANHYAARYCLRLLRHVHADSMSQGLRQELRHFYRLPTKQKIGHIESNGLCA
jgi:hypothetical protein